jgi:hypothetical protein
MVRLSDHHFYTSHKGGCQRKGGGGEFSGLNTKRDTDGQSCLLFYFILFYNFKTIFLGQKEIQKSRGFREYTLKGSMCVLLRKLPQIFCSKSNVLYDDTQLKTRLDLEKYVFVTAPLSLYFMKNCIFLQSIPSKEWEQKATMFLYRKLDVNVIGCIQLFGI